jgi:photosystem II stability/assembly factor-like uncharacterized protein
VPVQLPTLGAGRHIEDLETSAEMVLAVVGPDPSGSGGVHLLRAPADSDKWVDLGAIAVHPPVRLVLHGSHTWIVGAASGTWLSGDPSHLAPQPSPCGTSPGFPAELAVASDEDVVVACGGGVAAGSQDKPIFVSRDNGAHFTAVAAAPRGGDVGPIAAASASDVVVSAASGNSVLYGTFDGGRTWQTVYVDDHGGLPWFELGFTTSLQGVVVLGEPTAASSTPPSEVLMTRDGGHSWAIVRFGA